MDYQQLEQGMTIHGDLALFQVKKAMPNFKLPEIAEWKWNRRAARYLVRNGSQPPRGTFSVYDSGLFLVLIQLVEGEWVAGVDFTGPGGCVMIYRTP